MKLNWFKLVQFCLDLDQLPQKCIFFSEKCPKRVFLAFLKLLGDVVGEECLSPAEACLPLPFPIVLLSLHLIIYIGECLPQFPSLFSYGMWKSTPLMSVFKTETVPMRYCLIWF